MSNSRISVVALAAATVATFAVGITAVSAASAPKSVKACVNSKHALSLLSSKGKCGKGAHAVTIGVKGPKGAKGSNGLSTAYPVASVGTAAGYFKTTADHKLASRSLRKGNYVISWNVALENDSASLGAFQCDISYSGGKTSPLRSSIAGKAGAVPGAAGIAQTVPVTTKATGAVTLHCRSLSGTQIRAGLKEPQNLIAIAVNKLSFPPKKK